MEAYLTKCTSEFEFVKIHVDGKFPTSGMLLEMGQLVKWRILLQSVQK